MKILSMKFKMEKATKNTFKFAEVVGPEAGAAELVGSLYIQKSAFGTTTPDEISVQVTVQ